MFLGNTLVSQNVIFCVV